MLKQITINNEPYLYGKVDRFLFLYGSVDHTSYTIIAPGEFVLVDRHFNCVALTEAQMDEHIATDFRRFKRFASPPKESADAS